jgi:hypothetical protein
MTHQFEVMSTWNYVEKILLRILLSFKKAENPVRSGWVFNT